MSDRSHALSRSRGWLDVTLPLRSGMPVYPGDPPVAITAWTGLDQGTGFSVSVLTLGTHTGTHVDAPAHCIPGGIGVEALPLEALCGAAVVLDLVRVAAAGSAIGPEELGPLPAACKRLLLRTRDGALWDGTVLPDAGLSPAAATLLVERGVRLVGIDRLSIAPADDPLPVHRALLAAGVIILEGLDLRAAPSGPCELFCLPLKLAGADGAPARVALRWS